MNQKNKKTFNDVKQSELQNIKKISPETDENNLIGLAFSGGGIRSATVNLGVLQGLAKKKGLLSRFDYLSTVSGGGYIGAWFSALIHRVNQTKLEALSQVEQGLKASTIPTPNYQRSTSTSTKTVNNAITWLRSYSNYLTPKKGLSLDTISAAAHWGTNTILNQILLFSALTALLMFCMTLISLTSLLVLSPEDISNNVAEQLTKMDLIKDQITVKKIHLVQKYKYFFNLHPIAFVFTYGLGLLAYLVTILELFTQYQPLRLFQQKVDQSRRIKRWCRQSIIVRHLVRLLTTEVLIAALFIISMIAYFLFFANQFGEASTFLGNLISISNAQNTMISVIQGLAVFTLGFSFIKILTPSTPAKNEEAYRRIAIVWAISASFLILFCAAVYVPAFLQCHIIDESSHPIDFGRSNNVFQHVCNVEWSQTLSKKYFNISKNNITLTSLFAWVFSLASAMIGASKRSDTKWATAFSKFAPYLIITFIFIAAGYLSYLFANSVNRWFWFHCLLATTVIGTLSFNINTLSLHGFYRNRLTRGYLGSSNQERKESEHSNFMNSDDIDFKDCQNQRPFHIINTTLNISAGKHLAEQHRQGASFFFTPLHAGFDIARENAGTAFTDTDGYIYEDGPKMGGLIAISGAAASPNMGYHTSKVMGFIMTIFNARLGRWVGNPCKPAFAKQSGPRLNLGYLVKELFTSTNSESNYLYLSDGGHFENLGIYELVRRQCKVIVAVDAGKDDQYQFEDLGNAIRKCKVDFNVSIDIDVSHIQPSITSHCGTFKHADSHFAIGTIKYADHADNTDNTGIIIYIKNSLSGNEPADLINYKLQHADFPHRTTSDQFFDEPEFESYRCLGEHMIDETADVITAIFDGLDRIKLKELDTELLLKELYTEGLCRRKKRSTE